MHQRKLVLEILTNSFQILGDTSFLIFSHFTRLQILSASVDELTCRFFSHNNKKHLTLLAQQARLNHQFGVARIVINNFGQQSSTIIASFRIVSEHDAKINY